MRNLDLIAAETAQTIIAETCLEEDGKKTIEASEVENLVTKALGVLQENGVYAVMLYLYSRSNDTEKPIAVRVREQLLTLSSQVLELSGPENTGAAFALNFLTEQICKNLDRLLLIKQIWEQTLIYVRYGAKAHAAAKEVAP